MKPLDLLGKRFGKLVIMEKTHTRRGAKSIVKWKCVCDCGKEMFAETNTLTSGHSQTCGCGRIEAISTGYGLISGVWYGQAKRNAEKRGFKFDLSLKFLDNLLHKQGSLCAISGLPITIVQGRRTTGTTASLDRINNNKGYIKDNVQFVHKHVNYMKWTHSQDYFIELCQTIVNYQNEKHA